MCKSSLRIGHRQAFKGFRDQNSDPGLETFIHILIEDPPQLCVHGHGAAKILTCFLLGGLDQNSTSCTVTSLLFVIFARSLCAPLHNFPQKCLIGWNH